MYYNRFGKEESVHCGLMCIIEKYQWATAERQPIPLLSVNVTASVVHAVAQVEITQIYVNMEEQPIEAVYYFPVDSNGAVTLFEAEVEGRKIKGIAKAHEEAKEEYDKAIEQKQTAFLAEENKPDIFKVRVGFLKPGSQAKIVIGYVTEVKNEKDSNAIRFFLPTTVAPRYVPMRCTDEKSQDLAEMMFSKDSPASLSVTVNVFIQGEIKSIDSPTHHVTVSNKGPVPAKPIWTKALVELRATTMDMDRDFVLLITPEETHKPRLYLERTESSVAVMAHLIPSFQLDDQRVELIFVLDRSGSMQGQSITLAKKALTLFLHSLPVDCYFNIVGFGYCFEFLFPQSVKYDDGSLKKATTHAKDLDADLGGTEIFEPLKKIFSTPPIPGYLRQIFIITDGEVGNTDAIIGLTKTKAHESRVFSLGIGDSASHHLIDGVAHAGGGTSAFVTYNEKIDKKVMTQLKNALQPSLTNVNISWHGVKLPGTDTNSPPQAAVINKEKTLMGYGKQIKAEPEPVSSISNSAKSYQQAPEKVPPIFDGSQLLVFGVFGSDIPKPTGATITAESPDGPLSIEIEISEENNVGATKMLHKLASIKIVREIELKVAALGYNNDYYYGNNSYCYGLKPLKDPSQIATEETYKKEIIAIAVAEGFASKYTSFVAVDSADGSKTPEDWVMQTRFVPSQYAHGWHGRNQGFGQMQTQMQPMQQQQQQQQMQQMTTNCVPRNVLCSAPRRAPVASCQSQGPQDMYCSAGSGNCAASMPSCDSDPYSNVPYAYGIYAGSSKRPWLHVGGSAIGRSSTKTKGGRSAPPRFACVTAESSSEEEEIITPTVRDPLQEVVGFQSFNGSFGLEDSFIQTIGLEISSVKEEAAKQGFDLSGWATALALAFLSKKLAEQSESWELVAAKAKKWLQKNCAANFERMLTAAERLFASP